MRKRNLKVEQAIHAASGQLDLIMRTMYSDPKTALKLMNAAKDNIDIGAIALHIHIGHLVKK